MVEYKVVTERDTLFTGSFEPEELERVLNEYAAQGWTLTSGFQTQNIWKSMKVNVVFILERQA